jgi:hypothetical protein
MFKLSRAKYPIIFALLIWDFCFILTIFFTVRLTDIAPFFLIIFIPLLLLGLYYSIKDKEVWTTKTDERSKKVDYIALSYSWLITIPFIFIVSIFGDVLHFSPLQIGSLTMFEMLLTMLLLHLFFNFKGKF